MDEQWDQKTLGERMVLAAWMAVRLHLAQTAVDQMRIDAEDCAGEASGSRLATIETQLSR